MFAAATNNLGDTRRIIPTNFNDFDVGRVGE